MSNLGTLDCAWLTALAARQMVLARDIANAHADMYMRRLDRGRQPWPFALEQWREAHQLAREWDLTHREADQAYKDARRLGAA